MGTAVVIVLTMWAITTLVTKVPVLQRESSDGQGVGQSIGTVGSRQTTMAYVPNIIDAVFGNILIFITIAAL